MGMIAAATDEALARRAAEGQREAFEELVRRHRARVYALALRICRNADDAEDALQETLLASWQGLGGFEERSSVRTWLYRVATSRCLNALRSSRRRPQMSWPLTGVDPPEPTRLEWRFCGV